MQVEQYYFACLWQLLAVWHRVILKPLILKSIQKQYYYFKIDKR